MRVAVVLVSVLGLVGGQSPYAGQTEREIKSLAPEEIAGFLAGDGMGYALAAELNGFPGPRHVLELQAELELTAEQLAGVQASFDRMQAQARVLGAQLVDLERALDAGFAGRSIDEAALESQLGEIGAVEARLRGTHLRAHLETARLLTAAQIQYYSMLRGYEEHGHDAHGRHREH